MGEPYEGTMHWGGGVGEANVVIDDVASPGWEVRLSAAPSVPGWAPGRDRATLADGRNALMEVTVEGGQVVLRGIEPFS